MQTGLDNLTVLGNLLNDEAVALFNQYLKGDEKSFAPFVRAFYEKAKSSSSGIDFFKYVDDLSLFDDNIVSHTFAKGETPSEKLKKAYIEDMKLLYTSILSADNKGLFDAERTDRRTFEQIYIERGKIYKKYGCGAFIQNYAFSLANGKLIPIAKPAAPDKDGNSPIFALKNYREEKKLIDDNIRNFVEGLPHADMLLYGDRGTGKSSTLRATVQNYFDCGLRLIEIGADNLSDIPAARKAVENNPLKFVIFIDDLSLKEGDSSLAPLKACIEGTAAVSANTMIVATSNRRHIVKEKFSDRDDAVHASDTIQEQLSLSDRFGITVMFSATDKAEYLSIVKQIAADLGIKMDDRELFDIAERWAINKGGRSPRRAKQICDLIYACQQRGVNVDF